MCKFCVALNNYGTTITSTKFFLTNWLFLQSVNSKLQMLLRSKSETDYNPCFKLLELVYFCMSFFLFSFTLAIQICPMINFYCKNLKKMKDVSLNLLITYHCGARLEKFNNSMKLLTKHMKYTICMKEWMDGLMNRWMD